MRYQVPQFIEVEDKIFGPLTIKQFIYLAGGGGLCLIAFTFLPLFLTIIIAIPIIGFSLALAFYQVNERPLIVAIEHAFSYYLSSKLYLWKQKPPSSTPAATAAPKVNVPLVVPKLSESRLTDLAWSLNIKDKNAL